MEDSLIGTVSKLFNLTSDDFKLKTLNYNVNYRPNPFRPPYLSHIIKPTTAIAKNQKWWKKGEIGNFEDCNEDLGVIRWKVYSIGEWFAAIY